jgi:hypothetical protein
MLRSQHNPEPCGKANKKRMVQNSLIDSSLEGHGAVRGSRLAARAVSQFHSVCVDTLFGLHPLLFVLDGGTLRARMRASCLQQRREEGEAFEKRAVRSIATIWLPTCILRGGWGGVPPPPASPLPLLI